MWPSAALSKSGKARSTEALMLPGVGSVGNTERSQSAVAGDMTDSGSNVAGTRLFQQCAHGVQRAIERIQDQPQYFQRHDPQKRLITAFPQDDRRMSFTLRQPDVTLRDVALDFRAIR